MLQLVVMKLGDVSVAVNARFNACEGEVGVGVVGSAKAGQSRGDIQHGVDAGIIDGKQDGVAEFRTPAGKANRLGTFLTAAEVYSAVVRVFGEQEPEGKKAIDLDADGTGGGRNMLVSERIWTMPTRSCSGGGSWWNRVAACAVVEV